MKTPGEPLSPELVNLQPSEPMNPGNTIPLAPAEKPDAPC